MGDVTYINPGQQQIAESKDSHADVLHCLMISLSEEVILLPNAAVAEVIGYIKPEPLEGSPNWFLGRITWRERLVPLISIEVASSSSDKNVSLEGSRIAILNTLNGNPEVPYIGIVAQGIPRLNVIHNEDITSIETLPANRQSIAEIANANGQEVIIPDIDDLENRLLNLHS